MSLYAPGGKFHACNNNFILKQTCKIAVIMRQQSDENINLETDPSLSMSALGAFS